MIEGLKELINEIKNNKYEVFIGLFLLITFLFIVFNSPMTVGEEMNTPDKTHHLYFAIQFLITTVYFVHFRVVNQQLKKIEKLLMIVSISSIGLLSVLYELSIWNREVFPKVGTIWTHSGFAPYGAIGWILFLIIVISIFLNIGYQLKENYRNKKYE